MLKHLLYQTYRSQFGWLWMFWFVCVLQSVAGVVGALDPIVQNSRTIVFVGQCFLAVFSIAGGIQMHAMVGDRVFWKTRPIGRPTLLRVNVIYILGLVYLPLMLSLSFGRVAAGFSGSQLFIATMEWALYCGLGVALVSAAAVHSRNLATFFAVGGMSFLYFTSLGAGYNYLGNYVLDRPRSIAPFDYRMSSLLVALLLMMGAAAFSFAWRQLRNNIVVSISAFALAAILFYPIVLQAPFGFLERRLPTLEEVSMELTTERYDKDPDSLSEQILWSHFRATGVPAGSVLMPDQLSATFNPEERDQPKLLHTFRQQSRASSGVDYFEHSPCGVTAFRVLQANYPTDTVWSGRWNNHRQDNLPTRGKKRPQLDSIGRFSGSLQSEIVRLERVGDLPLENGFARLGGGYGVAIRLLTDEEGGLQFEITEAIPSLMFSGRTEDRHSYHRTAGIYVLYHPESREAILLDESGSGRNAATFLNNQAQTTLSFRVPRSRLRERLNGHERDDWSQGLRLHVYHHRRVGLVSLRFADDQYRYIGSHRRHISMWESDSRSGFESLQELKWPGTNDVVAARKFVRDFIKRSPANFYSNQATKTTKLLTDIGPEIVPFFLDEAPYSYAMGQIILRRAFQRLARPEHLPALKRALVRDPQLAWLVRSKRWEKECAPILADRLPNRESVLPADALIVLAKHATKDQYADLAWHAVRCESGQEYVYRNLRALEDFPYERTVREAWGLARLQFVSDQQLAVFAAELGELDALHNFIRQLNSGNSESRDRRAFEILRPKLNVIGDDSALREWLLKHANEIRFDADQDKYVI